MTPPDLNSPHQEQHGTTFDNDWQCVLTAYDNERSSPSERDERKNPSAGIRNPREGASTGRRRSRIGGNVDAVLSPHADYCVSDIDILCKTENKNVLKRRTAEELKTVPQIYHEEASNASSDLETAGEFPTYKSVKTAVYRKRAQKFPRFPPTWQQLEIPTQWQMTKSGRRFFLYNNVCLDGTFEIVPEWYQQMFTIHVFMAGGSVGGGSAAANSNLRF
ncbi:hypothetical protein T4D_4195 [Trichinella pseudospiralis]|uniref:Uncharacterized protein n=1 Tax=Trichinella pseudospiralis TaxID=6337 RepID=A0A0V1G306_TRIPS|nr:hypothetical protein T4D_4195 [Trichinella pseudospiralis]